MPSIQFSERSSAQEIMDDLNCSGEVVHQTLRELEFINRTLGGNSITVNGVRVLLQHKSNMHPEILDLGCGGGDMLVLLNQRFSRQFPGMKLHGIDANPNIVRYAQEHCSAGIEFTTADVLSSEFRKTKCDIAVATLFLHHFTSDQLIDLIKGLKEQCRIGIVINDLHRHPLAYYAIKILTRLFSKSSMVKFDAPLSVLRGFTRKEWIEILNQAGISNYTLNWRWAFRWEIIVRNRQ